MNVCITPELFTSFCNQLTAMLEEREQSQGIDFSEIKTVIALKQVELCE